MLTMLNRLLHITLFLALSLSASAQYPFIPGSLQGGPPAPGTKSRSPLNSLERAAQSTAGATILTDSFGNQRYILLDSVIVVIVDSIQADTTLQRNWYTHNGVTTDLGRTAFVKRTAWWRGLDTLGFMRFTMRPTLFTGTQSTLYHDSIVFDYINADGIRNLVSIADTGIILATAEDFARSVNVWTDTVNWSSSFDPTLQIHNLRADGTYFYADSLKVVGIGQFAGFPSLVFDGTDKGYYSAPNGVGFTGLFDGDGQTGGYSYSIVSQSNNLIEAITQPTSNSTTIARLSMTSTSANSLSQFIVGNSNASHSGVNTRILASASASLHSSFLSRKDTNLFVTSYLGESNSPTDTYTGKRAWGVRLVDTIGLNVKFDWIQAYLPNDTTGNQLSFYNRAYYWRNEHPIGAAGDTLFHFWAATGPGGEAGRDPGFMTLDDIRGSGVNWYNANGTTTDNTRIATVTETATWLSDDAVLNGVYPFRFELASGTVNEPEMMCWKFPGNDSLMLNQSDQEITFRSTNRFLLWSNEALIGLGDSVQLGHLPEVSGGDIVALAGPDGAPGNTRTLKSLEGAFNADVLSWSAGSAGDRWDAVPANRTSIATTSASLIPSESTAEILVDGIGGGTVELNYTPAMPGTGYTTYRYIYNATAGVTTVDTDQAWEFRDSTGDLGASFNLAAGENCKLIWIYDATPANARFFVIKF